MVVNKPSGMASVPSRSYPTNNLSSAVKSYFNDTDPGFVVRIINRLDKDTAGLICIAKHSLISNLLNSNNYIKKEYYAICTGHIKQPLVIDKPIATTKNKDGFNNQKREILSIGKQAVTYVEPILYDGKNTLCKMKLKFGRTHQIRLHLSSENHPLLGDELYGVKSDKISHTALVCSSMEIFNPLTQKTIKLKIDLPNDFNTAFTSNLKQF